MLWTSNQRLSHPRRDYLSDLSLFGNYQSDCYIFCTILVSLENFIRGNLIQMQKGMSSLKSISRLVFTGIKRINALNEHHATNSRSTKI